MVERIVVGLMNTNAYLYSEWKKECIIVDPGGDKVKIIEHMTMKNLRPRGIIFTHGHLDHISAAIEIQRHFDLMDLKVPVAVHEADARFFGRGAMKRHQKSIAKVESTESEYYEHSAGDLPVPDVLVHDGDRVFDSDLTVIHTPGHTPGSICLYSESQELLFSGDTLFFEGIGETDLSTKEKAQLLNSIRSRVLTLPGTIRVFPGHGPFTSVERELLHNPHLN